MKKLILSCFLLLFSILVYAQSKPKLIVGVVVDQMRWDFLYRYQDRYGNEGFNRLMNEGFSCENAFIPYTPTHTAAGHACIYTGTVPAMNGIIGNGWYDPQQRRTVYCAEDNSVTGVGTTSDAGKMSPRNLWSSTITDELRLASNFRNKTIAIALKDRGAILPGGHTANAAYWFDNATGGWISSTYYMNELPQWVKRFNDKKLPDQYLKQNWNTLYPLNTYRQSSADSNRYESKMPGEDISFPHVTANISGKAKYDAFRTSPFGSTYTLEMAKEAVKSEQLGKGAETDFLVVSFSSPDYIGHTFGPNSIEIEDTYLRLDRDMAELLKYLDAEVGKGNYLLFLTSDHGAAHNPGFLNDNKASGGVYDQTGAEKTLKTNLQAHFGAANIIEHSTNYQIYLNDSIMAAHKIDKKQVKDFIIRYLLKQHSVSQVVDLEDVHNAPIPDRVKAALVNGYNPKISGHLQVILKPGQLQNWRTGTSHGLWNPYDTHIPLIWFGWNVNRGKSYREVYMSDIAPTLAAMLSIQMPNAAVGQVISEVFTGEATK